MTVSAQTPINSYIYAGSPTFVYAFQLLQAGDLLVTVDGVTKTPGVDYTITGVGAQAGGSITFITTVNVGQLVSLSRQTTLSRTNDYQSLGDFLATTVNGDMDRLWMALQERVTNDARSIRSPSGETLATLPAALSRAGFLLGFDGAGGLALIAAAAQSATALALSLLANNGSTLVNYLPAGSGSALRSVQSKLRETVSPMDFGAVGNGIADDTTAFANALATGKDVRVPNGTYKITSSLTMSTTQQQLVGEGRLSWLQFVMAASSPAIIFTGSSGRQRVTGVTITASNCPKLFSFQSPQVQVMFNWLTNSTSGGIVNYLENENTGGGIYSFGTLIAYNFIHGSFSTGSRGVRLGLNSQTSQIVGNTIDFFESCISVENATDALIIEGNTLQTTMSTGHAIDMRGTSGSPTYRAVVIRGNHFEDVYSAICWGTNGASGSTYTSNVYGPNYFSGHVAGTNYFLTIVGTCGAGCANNRVINNDVSQNLTAFFNLQDQNGAASLIDTKGNTLGAGVFSTGTYASSAYQIRQHNGFFGAVVSGSAFTSQSVTRLEVTNTTFKLFLRWDPHEYLETIQFKYLPTGVTPSLTVNLHECSVDTDTVIATTGAMTTSQIGSISVNKQAVAGSHYYLDFVHTIGSGTAYVYPAQAYLRQ